MKILFAPDYREGAPYQRLLTEALREQGVEVEFLSGYRRGFPLWRGAKDRDVDAIHLHWPEKYFQRKGDWFDWFRTARYPFDLRTASEGRPLFLTAHNLLPHGREDEPGVFQNVRTTAQHADAIFVHSGAAGDLLAKTFGIPRRKCHTIPHGDQSVALPPSVSSRDARKSLGRSPDERFCLVFGTVSPYKGTEELIRWWQENNPSCRLVIVGRTFNPDYADELRGLTEDSDTVEFRLGRDWISDEDLSLWLSAADCTAFNYRSIFTSGAAALARSFGVPILIPERLTTVDLSEPHSHVFRFDALEGDFRDQLERALSVAPDFSAGGEWRGETSWSKVAETTANVYREFL